MSLALSELQLAVMRVLWARGEASVGEVHGAVCPPRKLAPSTIATVLARLEKRGVVAHRAVQRHFRYYARVTESAVRRWMVADVATRLFNGDAAALIVYILDEFDVPQDALDRIHGALTARAGRA